MSKYEDTSTATGGSESPFDVDRFENMATLFANQMKSKSDSFIDIGCANGGLLNALKAHQFTSLTGIDIAPKCVENVKSQGHNAYYGGVFNLENIRGKQYDMICLSHVLEHIRDVKEAAAQLDSICSEGGMIYIEVPDASRYDQFFIVPYYYFDCEHINHFDKYALANLFGNMGYEAIYTEEKVLIPTPNNPYPVLSMIFKKVGAAKGNYTKSAVPASIQRFVQESKSKFEFKQLSDVIEAKTPVIVWGAGQYTLRLMASSPLTQCNIIRFVDSDSNKHGNNIQDILIQGPVDVLKEYREEPIIITSALHSEAIKNQIQSIDNHQNRKLIIL